MKVRKVLNNNVVSSTNADHNEVIVMGKGIGYQKKIGDLIQDSMIEKIFILNDKSILPKLENLFKDIPEKYLEISDEIIQYARSQYGLSLSEHAYLSLTDHIAMAVERIKTGLEIRNVMLSDIKFFYKDEYQVGLKALRIIEQETGVALPDDEAGFIALHVLNASLDQVNTNNLETIKISHEILSIVNEFYDLSLDKESIHYYRFANHVNYLVKRLFSQSEDVESDDILYETARKNFVKEFECANLIKKRIYEDYEIAIPREELGYLIINLRAMLKNTNH